MKILYFTKEVWEEKYCKQKLSNPGFEVVCRTGTLQDALAAGDFEKDADAEILCVFVNSHLGAAELARLPRLRLIATRSTGFDHIDAAEAHTRGVAVATVPAYGADTVAEFAFALILALSRRVCEAHEQTAVEHGLSQFGLRGFDLAGKTLGIVGCGHIGTHVVQIAAGFGMKILVCDEHHDDALAQKFGLSYMALPELLAGSDIITLHAPYLPATHHLINRANIGLLKKGAYLINTARGALVETEALVEALKSGALAGAGLDVLEDERELTEEELFLAEHPRVIVTPHIAFDTDEAVLRIMDTTIENIKAFFAGTPQNLAK